MARKDIGDLLDNYAKRIYRLEQSTTNPNNYPGSQTNKFEEIYIGPPGEEDRISRDVDSPTDLVVATGAYEDDSYVDVSWTSPVGDNWAYHEVVLAEPVTGGWLPVDIKTVYGNDTRFSGLIPLKDYGVQVASVNRLGHRTETPLPGPGVGDFYEFAAARDQSNPNQVAGVALYSGVTSLVITWEEVTDSDVARGQGMYEVQVSADNTFTNIVYSKHVSGTITTVTGLNAESTYYVRIRAVDRSDNPGPWSDATSTAAAGVATDHFVAAGIDAAVIKFGSMSGDRITASSADIDILKSSDFSGKTITLTNNGRIRVGDTTNGIYIDTSGIRMWQSGVRKVYIPAGGNPTFDGDVTMRSGSIEGSLDVGGMLTLKSGGSFRSGTSSTRRITIEPDNKIRLYAGYSTWAWEIFGDAGNVVIRNENTGYSFDITTVSGGIEISTYNFRLNNTMTLGSGAGFITSSGVVDVNSVYAASALLEADSNGLRVGRSSSMAGYALQTTTYWLLTVGVRPYEDNTFTSGSWSYRWNTVYSVNGTSTGSDARSKRDIQMSDLGLSFICRLNPIKYFLKADENPEHYHYGVTTQDVEKAANEEGVEGLAMILRPPNGEEGMDSLLHHELFSPMIKSIQELTRRVEQLEVENA